VSYYGQYEEASEVPQDNESQEQVPTLEIGEEGYNNSEPVGEDGLETLPEEAAADPSEGEIPLTDDESSAIADQPLEADEDESAKLNNAE
jgi:hypothetical protein